MRPSQPWCAWRHVVSMTKNLNVLKLITCAAVLLAPEMTWAVSRQQSVEQLTGAADKIVLGTVLSRSSHWTSDAQIYTDVVVSADVSVKGDASQSSVVVQVPGGTVGDMLMTVSDTPEFNPGEHVLLFLNRSKDRFEVTGRSAGKFTLNSRASAAAVESVLQVLEAHAGHSLGAKRELAASFAANSSAGAVAHNLTEVQAGCYSTSGMKWPSSVATYKIGGSIPGDWGPSLDAASATWNAAGAALQLINDPKSANELTFIDLVAKYGSSFSNTYAITSTWYSLSTNLLVKAGTEINTSFQWSTSGDSNSVDVQNIMTHEFGHWLRLGDIYSPTSTCSEVTMWGYAEVGETKKQNLEQPDLDGFFGLYGPAPVSAPTPATSPNSNTDPSNGNNGDGNNN